MRLILAILLGKLIFFLSRMLKKGGGSAAPGLYALNLEPNLVTKLSSQIPQNIIITGTNGKTTTTRMLDHLVKKQNLRTLRNSTGSNLERGIASTLVSHANIFGQIKDIDLGIWETDEAAFNTVVFKLKPQIIVFLNAFRDQLDRYGEVDTVIRKWTESLEKINWEPKSIINGDDVSTAKLARKNFNTSTFKVKNYHTFGEKGDNNKLPAEFEAKIIKNKGLLGTDLEVTSPSSKLNISLPVPGLYHSYDFIAAFACYYYLNLPVKETVESLKNFSPAFGRVEEIKLGENLGYIFLIKNPAGASLVFETIEPELKAGDRILMALNDNFADGTDVSWIWDANFELVQSSSRAKPRDFQIICSGTRAYDLALRLKYAGVDPSQLTIEPDLEKAFPLAQHHLDGRLFILPTYTALLELQSILTRSKIKTHYWKEEA